MSHPTTSSASSTFIPRFCKYLNTEILFVRQKSGNYLKFQFDHSKNEFKRVECPDCRLTIKESDLAPLYPAWSNRLERYLIFARNRLNDRIEQYVYDREYEGFQQVYQSEIIYDPNRSHRHCEFFTVGGSKEEGVTVIKRDSKGRFLKEQLNWGNNEFRVISPVPVRLLDRDVYPEFQISRKRKTEMVDNKENEMKLTRNEVEKVPEDSNVVTNDEIPWKPQVEIVGNKQKLSKKDILEIRRLAELMGNPVESDSSDDFSSDSDNDYDDVPDEMCDIIESSC